MITHTNGFYDLASLAKPLVTAPLALALLDLDADRRQQLGFQDRPGVLTVRQLLSHSSGLPPWLPFTGEPLAEQIRRGFPVGAHALLRDAAPGFSTYSDLGYRLLGTLLEHATGRDFQELGAAASGLAAAPWPEAPVEIPDGPDCAAWPLATAAPVPPRSPFLPHDANARAGMRGHAGFGASPSQLEQALERWLHSGFPARMAVETARAEDGATWGLGLQRTMGGAGQFGALLERLSGTCSGVHVLASPSTILSPPVPEPQQGRPTEWWMHFGFTGPALFVHPASGTCIGILVHRRGPSGEMLRLEQLRARRWEMLARFVEGTP